MGLGNDLAIDISIEDEAWTARLGDSGRVKVLVERAVGAALTAAELSASNGTELSLLLCDDAYIRDLNRQWRGMDKPTNVLSFPPAAPMRAVTLGDIAVAYETSAREADERDIPLLDYLSHLIIHGVLHLFGFDHEDTTEADRMEALETRALAALGIASPYELMVEEGSPEVTP